MYRLWLKDQTNSVGVFGPIDLKPLYGIVILITTKRGRAGESRITYDADFSVPKIGPNFPKVLNAKEFLAVEDLAYKNMEKYDPAGWAAGKYVSRNPALARTDPRVFDAQGNPLFDTDWLDAATQHKISQNHQIAFSGGNETTTYSLSMVTAMVRVCC